MPSNIERLHRLKYIEDNHPFLEEIPRPANCIGCTQYMGAKIVSLPFVCGKHPNGYAGVSCPDYNQRNHNTEWDLQ